MMGLSNNESTIIEAVSNWLRDATTTADKHKGEERAHTFTFQHEDIEQQFRLQVMESAYYDGISSAFNKIHSHKYLDDPTFALSFKKEMSAQGIPEEDQNSAVKAVSEVLKSVVGSGVGERDVGWNPDLDKAIEASKPAQIDESIRSKKSIDIIREHSDLPSALLDEERKFYTDNKVRKWLNEQYPNHKFWERMLADVIPILESIGYTLGTPELFWEAYDDSSTDLIIRNEMHDAYENTRSEFMVNG